MITIYGNWPVLLWTWLCQQGAALAAAWTAATLPATLWVSAHSVAVSLTLAPLLLLALLCALTGLHPRHLPSYSRVAVYAVARASGWLTFHLEWWLGGRLGGGVGMLISGVAIGLTVALHAVVCLEAAILWGVVAAACWLGERVREGAALAWACGVLLPLAAARVALAYLQGDDTVGYTIRVPRASAASAADDQKVSPLYWRRVGVGAISAVFLRKGWTLGQRKVADGHICRFDLSADGRTARCIWCQEEAPVPVRGVAPEPRFYCPVCTRRTPREDICSCAQRHLHAPNETLLCRSCACGVEPVYWRNMQPGAQRPARPVYVCPLHSAHPRAIGGPGRAAFIVGPSMRVAASTLPSHSRPVARVTPSSQPSQPSQPSAAVTPPAARPLIAATRPLTQATDPLSATLPSLAELAEQAVIANQPTREMPSMPALPTVVAPTVVAPAVTPATPPAAENAQEADENMDENMDENAEDDPGATRVALPVVRPLNASDKTDKPEATDEPGEQETPARRPRKASRPRAASTGRLEGRRAVGAPTPPEMAAVTAVAPVAAGRGRKRTLATISQPRIPAAPHAEQ